MPKLNREILRAELIIDEGLRLKTYRCTAGKLSIGIGRNLDDVGILDKELTELDIDLQHVKEHGITKAQAYAMFENDIDRTEAEMDRLMPWWRQVDPVRQRVLLNMAFNMGVAGLMNFDNTLSFVRRGDYVRAASNMILSKWYSQVGDRAKRLVRLMREGPKKG